MHTPRDLLTDALGRRTMAEIQRKVARQGKRNTASRLIIAKGDKDKIAGWKQDFVRVLHIFNVSSIGRVGHSRI